ncbi:universal stress protein [Fulvivirga sedimenti]|uniref:Universal stress protein n=1 Tax=Fulvivirga sedimenti TaxID=2879465 RepID=A0A9X1HQE0_9BACT|nr:universal stress protein [Fulvivirga sedimenti]MCA6075295.1 universal stress protein [Fulvivirga sedimenti]MCA6076472.1 universal stress protein [Fulvivirga sedimenti]MCA6077600.1 universal stress protein [Fulvivirga sedimenti]
MKHILVPTDFSTQAGYAVDLGAYLARKLNAELTFLHVVVDGTLPTVHYTGEVALPDMQDRLFVLKLIEKGKEELAEILKRPDMKDLKVNTELHVGDIYYGVKDIISQKNIDLVVMGTKGSSGFEEFIIGSNAERVVRHAKCPVLTIHEPMKALKIERIVYANSLEKPEHSCASVLKDIQEAFNATIHLVRVNTPNNFKADHDSLPLLEKIAENSSLRNFELHVYNDATEEAGILNFAEQIDADMIAMATHGRTGLAHLLTGSLAESVVNHTHRPVLTYVDKDI